MRITVLGAGMVGRTIAADLATQHEVCVADISLDNLNKLIGLKTLCLDLSVSSNILLAIADADIVVGAVPGFMGYNTLKSVIEAGKSCVDISFFNEEANTLNAMAMENKVCVITDCGVAPGLHNILLGHHAAQMQVQDFTCYVGGLPFERTWPFQYKAPFSLIDVIEEYIRPSRIVENGQLIVREALSEAEDVYFEGIGTLTAFNTDGLRSLIQSFPAIPFMKEKTLRYPGHIELMKILRHIGFFDNTLLNMGEQSVSPIALTSKLLFKYWQYNPSEREFTIMRVVIKGTENGSLQTYTYNLFDSTDFEKGQSSMSRTTGFTCTATVNLLAQGLFSTPGVHAPEALGKETNCFHYIMQYLKDRNVQLIKTATHY